MCMLETSCNQQGQELAIIKGPIEQIWLSDFIKEARNIDKPEKHKTEAITIINRPEIELQKGNFIHKFCYQNY